MKAWEDRTSYSRGERGKAEPRTWALQLGPDLTVVVTRHIHHPPDVWLMSAGPFFSQTTLAETDVEEAKRRALCNVTMTLEQYLLSAREAMTCPG
jgi:hypothetical protein